ncbi:MAG: heat-inducible transcriptional repressor HrcA [Chloroflexota bacterium]
MSEQQAFPQLSKRQEQILLHIVQAYNDSPEPVSSKHIVETSNLSVSSATVRNEMARLEEMGYISAPHTSAGRIPTALGYRYVVRELVDGNSLAPADHHYIERKFSELPIVLEQWMRQAATVLARTAQTASLVTPPVATTSKFKHVELISIQGRLVLMVLVLEGGAVHQRMLTLAEPVSQGTLSESADFVNSICNNLNANQIRMKSRNFSELEREVAELAADLIDRSSTNQMRLVYRDGLSEVIKEFPDTTGAEQAVRVYEERAMLELILNDILQPLIDDTERDVHVVIAGNGHEEVSQLSLVLSRYGVPGQIRGTLGVLGPTNLNYGRAISTVRKVSGMMTNMLVDLYEDDSPKQVED